MCIYIDTKITKFDSISLRNKNSLQMENDYRALTLQTFEKINQLHCNIYYKYCQSDSSISSDIIRYRSLLTLDSSDIVFDCVLCSLMYIRRVRFHNKQRYRYTRGRAHHIILFSHSISSSNKYPPRSKRILL
jgi:hypothetical protein